MNAPIAWYSVYARLLILHVTPGTIILQQAREQLSNAGVSLVTGLHEPEVQEPPPLTPSTLALVSSKEHMELLDKQGMGQLYTKCNLYTKCTVDHYLRWPKEFTRVRLTFTSGQYD